MSAPAVLEKHHLSVEWFSVYFGNHPSLRAGADSLTGTPTVTPPGGSGLTVSSQQVVGTNRVKFKLSAGTPQADPYLVTVSCGTQTSGETLAEDCPLRVY